MDSKFVYSFLGVHLLFVVRNIKKKQNKINGGGDLSATAAGPRGTWCALVNSPGPQAVTAGRAATWAGPDP
jgi:hypothetical protein